MRSVAFMFETCTKYRTCKLTLSRGREREKERGGRDSSAELSQREHLSTQRLISPLGGTGTRKYLGSCTLRVVRHPLEVSLALLVRPLLCASFIIFQLSLFGDLSPIINIIPGAESTIVTSDTFLKGEKEVAGQ